MTSKLIILTLCALLLVSLSSAATVEGKSPKGYTTMLISSGAADTSTSSSFSLSPKSKKYKLFLLKNGSLAASVVAAVRYKNKNYSFADAKKQKLCAKSGAKVLMGFNSSAKQKLGTLKISANDGIAYLDTLLATGLDSSSAVAISNKSKCLPAATARSLGMGSISKGVVKLKAILASSDDGDGDGMPDPLDVDDDNDGVMDGYDTSDGSSASSALSAKVFSNLKLEVSQSLNLYTDADGVLSSSELDAAAGQIGLAMQVAGGTTNATELNCGGLSYCSTGGTGFANNISFPDSVDSDSDGFGTITNGPTGDFQLQPRVTASTQIKGGDTFVQVVTDASSLETEVPVLLNFVFSTTPAIKTLSMGGVASSIVYPANPSMSGSTNNPVTAPAGWDGKMTVTAYRPQRPGIPAAGEGPYVDIGNSKISIDIPNATCNATTSGGCSGNGPGNCPLSSYTTTDPNLSTSGDTLKDTKGDANTDLTNPSAAELNFVVDVYSCLATRGITFAAGQKVGIDLQFRSDDGDNAAQKFYIRRP